MSFSGGETSAYLLAWLLKNYPKNDIKVVFANTGEESEETLTFVKKCGDYFKVDITWLEYERLSFKIVNFNTAYRSHNPKEIANKWQNHPFRKYIKTFGIPNIENSTCTRELKEYIINEIDQACLYFLIMDSLNEYNSLLPIARRLNKPVNLLRKIKNFFSKA